MYRNTNIRHCPDCGGVIGYDGHWDYHIHCNLACKWLGRRVMFTLGGQEFTGEVIETERCHLANGIHDIVTVEFFDNGRQLKIQGHRQSFRHIGD